MTDSEPPSSLSGATVSAQIPSIPKPTPRWRVRLLFVMTIVLALGTVSFGVMGALRDSSLDVPLPHDVRLGFHRNDWPHRWTCPQHHDHWSIPYWSGTVMLALVTLVVFFRYRKRAH